MPPTEDTVLQELAPSGSQENVSHATQNIEDVNNTRHLDSRFLGHNRHRAYATAVTGVDIIGFAMSYGVLQDYYSSNWTLSGAQSSTGIVGTTFNGVIYLLMPLLFGLYTRRWAHLRQTTALIGAVITSVSFLLSSFSTSVWHLIITQGIMAAIGCALVYSPMTLSLGEWFTDTNRALAYGIVLSCKNIVGSACPFLFRALLDKYGLGTTLRIWATIISVTCIPSIFLVPAHPSRTSSVLQRSRKIPWQFLKHQTIYIYSFATALQSSGYGIPQTYINTYAHEVVKASQTSATLMLTIINIPGILSSSFFSYLSDNKSLPLTSTSTTAIASLSSALAAFLLWGLTSQGNLGLLIMFSVTFGFFSSGYSATWGGVINELEREAAEHNEAVDAGLLYGLLNGARGLGYVSGGLASVPLLKAGSASSMKGFAFGTSYGPLIIFTGLSSLLGGWAVLWRLRKFTSWRLTG